MTRILFIFAYMILFSTASAQNDSTKFTGFYNYAFDAKYERGDSTATKFFSDNMERIVNLGTKIFGLPFDDCHNSQIQVELFVDSFGMTREVIVLVGSGYYNGDVKIRNAILNYQGNWEPAMKDGLVVPFHGTMTFKKETLIFMHFLIAEKNRTLDNYGYNFTVGKFNCKDNEFYYGKAITAFREQDYTLAAKYFRKSIDNNKYDANATFNLGIAYVHLNKLTEACECFKLADEYGELDASAKLKKYCEGKIKSTE